MSLPSVTRRSFVGSLAAATAAASLPAFAAAAPADIRFGYAAITWGDDVRGAIDDIAAVGFAGVQLRANALTQFQPAELQASLAQHKLALVALSSGDVSLEKPLADEIARNVAHAQYLKEAGGSYLQILDAGKPAPRTVTPEECRRLGLLLTELGKRTADLGIPLGYHNHMGTMSERPDNLDRILEAADPRFVKLELDIAHSAEGGGDPVRQIAQYHDRLLFLHLKDVVDLPAASPGARPGYHWVELGRGKVDLPGVFAALGKARFRGWAVVELDKVPVSSGTPKQSAEISRDYLTQKFGVNPQS